MGGVEEGMRSAAHCRLAGPERHVCVGCGRRRPVRGRGYCAVCLARVRAGVDVEVDLYPTVEESRRVPGIAWK